MLFYLIPDGAIGGCELRPESTAPVWKPASMWGGGDVKCGDTTESDVPAQRVERCDLFPEIRTSQHVLEDHTLFGLVPFWRGGWRHVQGRQEGWQSRACLVSRGTTAS